MLQLSKQERLFFFMVLMPPATFWSLCEECSIFSSPISSFLLLGGWLFLSCYSPSNFETLQLCRTSAGHYMKMLRALKGFLLLSCLPHPSLQPAALGHWMQPVVSQGGFASSLFFPLLALD
jgi:hypothetical protein